MFGISAYAQSPYASLGTNDISVALTGKSASAFVGTLTPSGSPTETGDIAYGYVGTVGVSVTVALTGLSATGFKGTLSPDKSIAIAGRTATGSSGSLGVALSPALSGLLATASQGAMAAVYWTIVIDSQDANWQNIADAQTAGHWLTTQKPLAGC